MRNYNTFPKASEAPFDYIDFPVSDTYRDHYAAQGLTYPSGRRWQRPRAAKLHRMVLLGSDDRADTLTRQNAKLEREVQRLGKEVAQFQEQLWALSKREPVNKKTAATFTGIPDLDACTER